MRKYMRLGELGLHTRYVSNGLTERLLCVLIAFMVTGGWLFAAVEGTITGTADDTSGVYLFSAGTDAQDCGDGTPAGEPTDDIIQEAINYSLLELAGDTAAEIVGFTTGSEESNDDGSRDSTQSAVLTGLSDIDDFWANRKLRR